MSNNEDIQSPQGSVVIIGAGTQGRRLAYMWSIKGRSVYLVDLSEKQLQESLRYVQQLRSATMDHIGMWGEIKATTPAQLESALNFAWLVIECVPESLSLKQKIVAQLDRAAPMSTIIASNSSSYGIAEIIQGMELKNSKRLLSAHCSIEIMGHKETDPTVVALLFKQCQEHGFTPFHVKQSSIGYIYNRIWAAIKRETLLALSEGICGYQEIDAIFKDVLKTPKGPCEQMDIVGLDVVLDIENHYADSRSGIPAEPREYLQKMIQNGQLGVKSGRGFYDYTKAT
ncbi:hypothetical protein BDV29DRAFT_189899 [Aspergillus leporis]|uniref:3-hydroxyacyl-CoA dehydrogenase n=1 Tax=Aspergillus leporis TaxID=41062 RepID=A0A5N5X9A1_9EURO|nr:hypothetical protein BDV29DRAFT_189899 [Aspergillus leporis]